MGKNGPLRYVRWAAGFAGIDEDAKANYGSNSWRKASANKLAQQAGARVMEIVRKGTFHKSDSATKAYLNVDSMNAIATVSAQVLAESSRVTEITGPRTSESPSSQTLLSHPLSQSAQVVDPQPLLQLGQPEQLQPLSQAVQSDQLQPPAQPPQLSAMLSQLSSGRWIEVSGNSNTTININLSFASKPSPSQE